jgi:hypothetical protein
MLHIHRLNLPYFQGVGVRVYATIPSGKGTSTVAYGLTQGSSLMVWQPSGSTTIYGKEVFYSGVLPPGAHTLVMANMGEDNDMDFELDRIVVELGGSSSTSAQACKSPDVSFKERLIVFIEQTYRHLHRVPLPLKLVSP